MKKDLTQEEIEKRFKEINAREQEEPTPEDLIALSKADLESAEDAITLEEYKTQKKYSGRLMIRIPKELHRDLIEAAKKNGVSLNQYAMYKLAK
jgi:predicted HicB family RNase H-like nuclease